MPSDPYTLRRFTVREYYAMAEAGILDPDERVELLDGQVVAMSPIGARHAERVSRLTTWFVLTTQGEVSVRTQNPIRLNDLSEPEPDIAVVRPDRDYRVAHPRPEDVLLLIEVADTTLKQDLRIKVPLYARAGISEVWVVDLDGDRLHVFRDPDRGAYRFKNILDANARIAASRLPALGEISVRVLLGEKE